MYKKFTINGQEADGQTLKAGSDYDCQLIIHGTGQAGATIKFLAKQNITDLDSAAVITKSGSDVTTTIGTNVLTATFSIAGSETEALEDGLTLVYGIQRTISSKDTVIEEGKLKIEAAVIKS